MIFNVSGGGGTALNFKVVGNPQPSSAKENTIWIDTDTITSWLFSATEPSPAEPGMVWITIDTSSTVEFNALKKNGIQVYPISAKQYVSGAWVDQEAKIFQNGVWNDVVIRTYLFKEGDVCTDITGGLTNTGITGMGSNVSVSNNRLVFGTHSGKRTANLLNREKNTYLYIEIDSISTTDGDFNCALSPQSTGDLTNIYASWYGTDSGIVKINISNVSAPFYLYMYTYKSTTVSVKNIWMA